MVIRTIRCANIIGSVLVKTWAATSSSAAARPSSGRRPASWTASVSAASSPSTDAALARVCVAGCSRDSRRVIWRRTESGVVAPATSPARIESATATTRYGFPPVSARTVSVRSASTSRSGSASVSSARTAGSLRLAGRIGRPPAASDRWAINGELAPGSPWRIATTIAAGMSSIRSAR